MFYTHSFSIQNVVYGIIVNPNIESKVGVFVFMIKWADKTGMDTEMNFQCKLHSSKNIQNNNLKKYKKYASLFVVEHKHYSEASDTLNDWRTVSL